LAGWVWMIRTLRPAATARFSVQPVAAATMPKAPTIAVPMTGLAATARPAITSATSRPCRFAKPVLRRPVESAQYASEQITTYAANNGITRSMGYTGICLLTG